MIFMENRSMPVCFTEKQFKMIEEFAKRNGMLNASQALEKILNKQSHFLIFLFCLHLQNMSHHKFSKIWGYLAKSQKIVQYVIKY